MSISVLCLVLIISKLQTSRKLGKENWNIEKFLSSINQEITARENFEDVK